jgi:hypothetical protein
MAGVAEMADDGGGFDSGFDVDVSDHIEEPSQEPVETAAPSAAADDGDDLDKATNLDELKAALKKRSPTKEDRSAIDARLAGMSDMERELVELRAWRKANEKPAAAKTEEKPPDEWDELLGKGPEYVQRKAEEIAKRLVEERFSAIDKRITEREYAEETKRQVKSREALLAKHPDGHETLLKFRELAKQYPGLEQRALASEDPAAFAYTQQKQYERMQKYATYEDMIRGEAARIAQESGQAAPAQIAAPSQRETQPQRKRPMTLAAVRGGNAAVSVDDEGGFPNF